MNQMTFTDIEYSNRRRKTKREEFLDAMDKIIPWVYWVDMICPYYAFLIVKNQMGYAEVAYCGIGKNMNRFNVLFSSANFLMCSRAGRTR